MEYVQYVHNIRKWCAIKQPHQKLHSKYMKIARSYTIIKIFLILVTTLLTILDYPKSINITIPFWKKRTPRTNNNP